MIDIINRYARVKAEHGDESLTDLGLDALDLMGIALAVEEEHGVYVSDAEIERWMTVGDVARIVGEA